MQLQDFPVGSIVGTKNRPKVRIIDVRFINRCETRPAYGYDTVFSYVCLEDFGLWTKGEQWLQMKSSPGGHDWEIVES